MALETVQSVTVWVSDLERALEFYVDSLGLQKRMDEEFGGGQRFVTVGAEGDTMQIVLSPREVGRVGEFTGLIFGVAYWLFPRSDRLDPVLSDRLGWAAYGSLNTGLLLRVATEPVTALDPATPVRWLLPLAALLQLGGACAFAATIWPRVRAR